jgi:UMF1 family MFS transporter
MALYIPANIAYQLGENFLASFLPEISTRQTMGRVSGIGWSMGYLGALMLLALTFGIMLVFGLEETSSWRPLFVFAGLWFVVMMIPTALFLHEKKRAERDSLTGHIAMEGFRRLGGTVKRAKEYRHLARFLIAFLIYGFGVQVVIFFSTPIAEGFGIEGRRLVLFVAQITVVAGITAMLVSRFQDNLGHRRTVEIFVIIWAVNAIGLAVLAYVRASSGAGEGSLPTWPVWLVGNGLGIGLGGIGTSSRTMVGVFTPAHRTAEFFGLWGLTYKLAGCIGVLSFGVMRDAMGPVWALGLLASFFVVGFLILLSVDEREGMRTAAAVERAHEAGRQSSASC